MSNPDPLSPSMKATLALLVAFMVYFVAGIALTLATGPFDIYAALSLAFLIPYGAFFFFCRQRKRWAFMASSILSIALFVAVPVSAWGQKWSDTTPYLTSMSTIASILFAMLALEAYKAYSELKS